MSATSTTTTGPMRSGPLAVNGLSYYDELRGHGEPLLFPHGELGSIEMFGPVLAKLAWTAQVAERR